MTTDTLSPSEREAVMEALEPWAQLGHSWRDKSDATMVLITPDHVNGPDGTFDYSL